ncbi:MAG: thiamine pyrophosphate-binding protein [Sphingomonas sp.]
MLIEIPVDVLFRSVNESAVRLTDPDAGPPPAAPADAITDALDLLSEAKRPVIMAGAGVMLSRSGRLLTQLAELVGAPVLTNCKAHGAIPDSHPLCGGDFSTLLHLEGSRPDVALLLGARLGRYTGGATDSLLPFDTRLVVVDIDGAETARLRDPEIRIHADCREALTQLIAGARERAWPERSRWQGRIATAGRWHEARFAAALTRDDRPIHPYRAAHEVMAALEDPIVVTDGGDAISWTEMATNVSGDAAFMVTGYFGCLGTGLPFALGASVGAPERQVVCVTGDGALGFNIQEFDTLARHGLPVVVAVMNNSAWGMSLHGQIALYGNEPRVIVDLAQTRYDQVAQAFGCYGELVVAADEIGPAIARARASGKPSCINIIVDAKVPSPFTEQLIGQKKKESDILIPYYDAIEQ